MDDQAERRDAAKVLAPDNEVGGYGVVAGGGGDQGVTRVAAGGSGGILHQIPGWMPGKVEGSNIPFMHKMPVRQEVLATADKLINGDRQKTYGDAAKDFTRTGKMWAAILGLDEVTPEQVALCMVALKMGRLCETVGHTDSWVDGIGYLALGAEIASKAR